jgi:hypothetical protein
VATINSFVEHALAFNGVVAVPHFDRTAFKANKIFATLHEPSGTANLKFTVFNQTEFCNFMPDLFNPLPNKWGLQGWTLFYLEKAENDILFTALETAYNDNLKKP